MWTLSIDILYYYYQVSIKMYFYALLSYVGR